MHLIITAVGLLGVVSASYLIKNNMPTMFGQPVTTSMNSTHMLTILQTSVGSSSSSSSSKGIFHVAIFRFAKEHVNDAIEAFRALASSSRQELGNLRYDIYRSIDDPQEFYVVEHWASLSALDSHEQSNAFIHFGQGVLVKYATLHDTVTARAFDVG